MIDLLELSQSILLGAGVYLLARVYADLYMTFADGCTCRKGAWDPECPVHGRGRPKDEPFPGADPW